MPLRVRYFGYLGVLLLVFTAALLAVFGLDSLDVVDAVQVGLLVLAGLCGVAGGFANPLRERVGALRLVGLADVSLGASMAVSADTVTDELVPQVVFVLGGLCIALVGASYLLPGRLFETAPLED